MIDIHTHILPGLDDGASDIYDTLEMVKIAADSGVTAMVATPHCNIPGVYESYYNREYIETFQRVTQAVRREQLPVKILPGMEVFGTPDLPKLIRQERIMSLNRSSYLLMEFAFDEDAEYVDGILESVRSMGIRPVAAHVERYRFVQKNPEILYKWKKKGYLMQINKGSFMGRFGKDAEKMAFYLMDQKLVSVIASDAHSPRHRTPYLRDVYEELKEKYPEEYLEVLFEKNPQRICKNRPTICL